MHDKPIEKEREKMGYRSEVVLAVNKEIMPEFLAHLATNEGARNLVYSDADHTEPNYEHDGSLLVAWSGIKWYEGYPDVDTIEKFMSMCEEDAEGRKEEMFRFVRIGEDYEDIETRGYGFEIYVNRTIDY